MSRISLSLALSVLVGVLCIPMGAARAQVEAPDAEAARPYLRQMQSDLRNLVTAQEAYFADNIAYAPSIPAMGGSFISSRGVTVVILNLFKTGWSGIAVHEGAPGYVCGIYVGMDDAVPPLNDKAEEGVATCKGPDGSPLTPA